MDPVPVTAGPLAATSHASRVLPAPPGPVRVSRRVRPSAWTISAISRPRPTKDVCSRVRLPRPRVGAMRGVPAASGRIATAGPAVTAVVATVRGSASAAGMAVAG